MTSINTNINALYAQSSLSANTVSQTTAMQQLSTGMRINSAKDDAAGLAIATRMNSNVRGLAVAIRNANDGISMAQTAESSLGSVVNMLQRMRELAVQSVNGTLTSQNRANMQIEVGQLVSEIDNISKTANFNGIKLFDGSAASVVLQTNVSTGDVVKMSMGAMNSGTLGLGKRSALMAQGFDNASVTAGSLTKGISSGDLVINGVVIGSSIAADDNASSTDKESSAISKVAAINRSSALTGVTAEVGATVASGVQMVTGTAGNSGTITINGVTTGVITLKGNKGQDRNQAVDAINAISGATGVRAVDTGSDSLGVQLVAADGRNIAVSFAGTATGFAAANVGVNMANFEVGADPTTNPISIYTGTYSLQTTTGSPITIGTQVSGNISNSGLTVGSYAPNTSYLTTTPRGNAGTATAAHALAAGDLVINGYTIAASIASDDTSSDTQATGALKEASAIAIAAAINKSSAQTGVKAIANANMVVGSGFVASAGNSGTLYVNGVAVTINAMTANTKAIEIVSAINTVSGASGVVASDNGSGITLTAADGRNISLATNTGDTLELANLGLIAPASAQANGQNPLVALTAGPTGAICNYGGVTLVSDKSFTISGGANTTALSDLAALGLQEGIYGGSNNGIKIRDLNIATVEGANDALGAVDAALMQISDMRSNLGAIQNRLQSAIENLTSSQTNMQQSVSRIADTDYGTATTAMSRAQIINQAATAMLAQANQQSQLVLQLLK
jgi:flagellin